MDVDAAGNIHRISRSFRWAVVVDRVVCIIVKRFPSERAVYRYIHGARTSEAKSPHRHVYKIIQAKTS